MGEFIEYTQGRVVGLTVFKGYPILVLAPVCGLASDVLFHIVISRLNKGRNQMIYLFGGFIGGLICTLFLAFSVYHAIEDDIEFFIYLALAFISYLALAYGYFHFVNINIASLRIRLLHEICDAKEGLSEEDILSRYNAQQTIDNRIQKLITSKQLIERDGRYFLGQKQFFLILFWFFEVMKYAILGRGNRTLFLINKFWVFRKTAEA